MEDLYIYVDESGNFDFSPKGTEYFVITSASFLHPQKHKREFDDLKYNLLKDGQDVESFHASPDKQNVRDNVFNIIESMDNFEVDSVVAQKNKANLKLYKDNTEEKFYGMIAEKLLQYVARRFLDFKDQEIDNVVVVFDAVFTKKKRKFVTKKIKQSFKANFNKIPYVYFHKSESDYNCQIVDYCCWSIYVKWERNRSEMRPYNKIEDKIRSELEIFKAGDKKYY